MYAQDLTFTDISVLDPVSAHIELIEGNNVLRKVIADAVIANLSVITDKILQFTRAIRKSASSMLSAASQLIFAHKMALPSYPSEFRFSCKHGI